MKGTHTVGSRRQRLIDRRKAVGLSQERLAEAVRVDSSTVARWERGETDPLPVYRPRLAEALNVPVEKVGELIVGRQELTTPERHLQADQPSSSTETIEALQSCGRSASGPTVGEVVMPLDRRGLLLGGVGSLLGVFALEQLQEAITDAVSETTEAPLVIVNSPAHLDEILAHLREQWHVLVRTDNLLGPQFTITGVRGQIAIIDALLVAVQEPRRAEVVRLGAQYAESAAWLYEDANDLVRSRYWLSRAMEWAYEVDDKNMLAWTAYRRSCQAVSLGDAAKAVGLARAARREEASLPTPTRAAVRVSEARGRALGGEAVAAQRLLDEAHTSAASDATGDARDGHGSFCTPGYIEIHRADCLTVVGQAKKAIALYEQALPTLPTVYQRDRAAGLSRLAAAYVLDGQPEQAASVAQTALPAARGAGSRRIAQELHKIGAALEPHRELAAVGALLEDLRQEAAA